MLSPKKVKFRKQQKGRMKGFAYRGGKLNFGSLFVDHLDFDFRMGQGHSHPAGLEAVGACRTVSTPQSTLPPCRTHS